MPGEENFELPEEDHELEDELRKFLLGDNDHEGEVAFEPATVVPYVCGESDGGPDFLRNRVVIPIHVEDLRRMIDGLRDADIVELNIPIG